MTTESSAGDDPGSLSIGDRYDLLSSRYRRYALYCLFIADGSASLPAVADYVTELEHGVPADGVPDERLHFYMTLYHAHVPRLANVDVVRYHQDSDDLELGPNAADLESELERAAREELTGSRKNPFASDQ